MRAEPTITVGHPASFSAVEKEDFIAMVRAGGEVEGRKSLEDNVRDAERLVFARIDGCLMGVAALKNPKPTYRAKVAKKSDQSLDARQIPFEFGYLFVLPSAREQKLCRKMWQALIEGHEATGIFATARLENKEMAAILPKFKFERAGDAYQSSRGKHKVQLYVRRLVQSERECES